MANAKKGRPLWSIEHSRRWSGCPRARYQGAEDLGVVVDASLAEHAEW